MIFCWNTGDLCDFFVTILPQGPTGIRKCRINGREDEALFGYFAFIDEPLRRGDTHRRVRRLGLSESHPAMPVSPKLTRLVTPICHRDERVGAVFLAEKEAGRAFTAEDEETQVKLAARAAAAQDRGYGVGGVVESTDEAGMLFVLLSICLIPVTHLQ